MVDAVQQGKLAPFTTVKYVTKDGENCTATKNNGVVTVVGDKTGTRQLPLDKFMEEFVATLPKVNLENTPKADTVAFSGLDGEEVQSETSSKKMSKGVIAGLATVGAALVAGGIYFLTRGKSKKMPSSIDNVIKKSDEVLQEVKKSTVETVEKAKETIKPTIEKVDTKVNETIDKAKEKIQPVVDKAEAKVSDAVGKVKEKAQNTWQELVEKSSKKSKPDAAKPDAAPKANGAKKKSAAKKKETNIKPDNVKPEQKPVQPAEAKKAQAVNEPDKKKSPYEVIQESSSPHRKNKLKPHRKNRLFKMIFIKD